MNANVTEEGMNSWKNVCLYSSGSGGKKKPSKQHRKKKNPSLLHYLGFSSNRMLVLTLSQGQKQSLPVLDVHMYNKAQ